MTSRPMKDYYTAAYNASEDCIYHLEVARHLDKVIGRERDEAIIDEHQRKALNAKNRELRFIQLGDMQEADYQDSLA